MAEEGRVAVVSGGNRGIGREVVRQLAAQGYTVVLGSRDAGAGERAAEEIEAEVLPRQLDVADRDSVERFVQSVRSQLGRVDALVNNAGVVGDTRASAATVDLDEVGSVMQTNLFGAWRLSQALLPLLRESGSGRIANVSSGMGQLQDMGGGAPAYRVSKTGLNALTRILANEERGSGLLVNCACPGWVRTDMGGSGAPRTVQEGADTPVWLATLPDGGPTGGFFRDRKPIPW